MATAGGRGEYASSPFRMPRAAWRSVLARVKDRVKDDNLTIVAAGVAFYGFLAIFPALAALVIVYGLMFDPGQVAGQIERVAALIPQAAAGIITSRLEEISGSSQGGLGFGLLVSLFFALWSATKGVQALMTAMNIAYQQEDTRGFIAQTLVSFAFVLGAIVFVILAFGALAAVPVVISLVQLQGASALLLSLGRWVVLALLIFGGLAVLYRYAPSRESARLKWIAPGAATAGVLWLVGSIAFSIYVQNFGNYDEMFGPLSAVVVLLMWFWLSALVVCLGAEINSELELQTYTDTTTGPPRRRGRRGAFVADHTRGAHGEILT